MTAPADRWASGEKYEPYIGRWSRLVAREFIAWLDVPPARAVARRRLWDRSTHRHHRPWLIKHFWAAAADLDPAAHELHEGLRFPFCRPAELEAMFTDVGLVAVTSRAIVVPTVFPSFERAPRRSPHMF